MCLVNGNTYTDKIETMGMTLGIKTPDNFVHIEKM